MEGSLDAVQATLFVASHPAKTLKLSDYRFEGFIHPEAYLDELGRALTLRSWWAERHHDVQAALSWLRSNRSRHERIFRRKASRFRLGSAMGASHRLPAYFRNVALNASHWIEQLKTAGVAIRGSYINLGAADGVNDDPLHAFAIQDVQVSRGPALAVEAQEALCARHREALPWVTLVCEKASTRNLGALVQSVFPAQSAREAVDVLKVDVDSFEGPLIEEAIQRQGLRPKLLLVEINAGIPPPLQYALLDSPQLERFGTEAALAIGDDAPMEVNAPFAGVSISYLVRRLAPYYVLLELGSPDAVFLRADLLPALGRKAPLDEFQAFARGWVDVHGFSRHQLRRWLFELDEVEALGEFHAHLAGWMLSHLGAVLPFTLGI